MAEETYKGKINRDTDWGGDMSTNGLPVAGSSIQTFLKEEIGTKIGAVYKPEGGNDVLCFATVEDRDSYIDNEDESLVIDRFETVSNYSIHINTDDLITSKSVIYGTTGNTIEFQFKITDINDMVSDSKASIEYSFLSAGLIRKYTTEVQMKSEGWTTVISDVIDDYLRNGENTITISITGLSTKTSSRFIMTYNIFDLSYETTFDYNVVKDGNSIIFPYSIYCSETKYLEFYLDGVPVSSSESMVIGDVYKSSIATISTLGLGPGQHSLQTRAYVKAADGTKFYSDSYYFTFAKSGDEGVSFLMRAELDNTQEIALEGHNLKMNVDQFKQVSFEWSIYDYYERRLTVNFEYDGALVSNAVVDKNGDIKTFSFRPMDDGEGKTLRIYAVDDNNVLLFKDEIEFDVNEASSGIKETTDGLLLKLQSVGRRNSDLDKDVWSCMGTDSNEYHANFHNFAWNTQQGWDDETESLVISNDAYVDFNIQPMINHWETNGGTIEMDLETFDINDDNALICECINEEMSANSAYFRVTATNAEFSTAEGKKINTRYKDNDRLKIAFIGNSIGTHEDGNLIYIVINGVLERAILYQDTDRIYSKAFLRIGSGNGGCKVRLRSIRVYNKAITVDEEFNNFVVDSENVQVVYEKNNVLKPGTNDIGFDEVANKLPVMIFTGDMAEITKNGQDKKWRYFDVEYINRQEPARNFVSFNCQMKLQGTSSLGYPRKNFKLKTRDKQFTEEKYLESDYVLDMENTEVGNRRLRSKRTGRLLDFGEVKDLCLSFDSEGNVLKKGKYKFREDAHSATKWTLKADFMESSCSHNVAAGRSWNAIFENTEFKLSLDVPYTNNTYRDAALIYKSTTPQVYEKDGVNYRINTYSDAFRSQKDYVCRTTAQKICKAENADDIRTAVDGFPMVCFYRTSHQENDLVFMGQYNFINDKSSYEVFGFEDIEDPEDENTMIYDATKVEVFEGLKNANPISLFKTLDNWDDPNVGWRSTYESRYPDPDDEGVAGKRQIDGGTGSALYYLSEWLLSTRHESDTVYDENATLNIDADFAERINEFQYGGTRATAESYQYAKGTNLPDNAENRQKKFETEKWEHFDVWKLAGYYIYLMRYGAVDQFVKNTMLFTDGNGLYDTRTEDKHFRKWFFINYDNDCLFGLRNNGELAFHWDLDRQTLDGATEIMDNGDDETNINTYAMMCHDSTLWNNLERDDEFMRMVRDLDNAMSLNGLNYDNMVTEFDTKQTEQWCERIYNANERYKYIQAAKGIGDMSGNPVDNLWMLQGTRRSHRHWWIANHFNLLDAKWLSGNYKNTYVNIKTDCFSGDTIHAVAGSKYYFAWGQQKKIYESNMERNAGDPIDFVFSTNQVQGDPVYIYAINKLSELDFSDIAYKVAGGSFEFHVGNTDVANDLKKLVIGNPNVINNVGGIVTSSWVNLPNLEYLDIQNYKGLQNLPLSSFKNLHTFIANGSGIGSFAPANGTNFDLVKLPQTVSTIIMNDVGFSDFANDFVFTPSTNLVSLTLSNNNGIGQTYYTNLVKPWIESIEASASKEYVYSEASIDISNIRWSFSSLDAIRLFKNFKQHGLKFSLRGTIDLRGCGNLSMDNINELKEMFGDNCFNEAMASLYVVTPESVFISADKSSVVAGKSVVFSREIYPDERALSGMVYQIDYLLVEETNESPIENPEVISDVLTGKRYLPVTNISAIRTGVTFTNYSENGKQYARLDSDEIITMRDSDFLVMVRLVLNSQTKVSVMKVTVQDPTYAKRGELYGEKSVYKNNEYIYDLSLYTNSGTTPSGTIGITWEITGADVDEFISEYEPINNGYSLRVVTSEGQPEISSSMSIIAHIDNLVTNDFNVTLQILYLNETVIMTDQSNPKVINICYRNGWSGPNAMTIGQALAVTSIGNAFTALTTDFTFNEFKYFTNVTSLETGAFMGSGLNEITFPTSLTEIGNYAFQNCAKLTKLSTTYGSYILPNLHTIKEGTFFGCTKLNKLRLPESVVDIEQFAFGGTGFKYVLLSTEELDDEVLLLPSNILSINKNAFEKAEWSASTTTNKLKVLSIPKTLSLVPLVNTQILWGTEYEYYIVEEGSNYRTEDGIMYANNILIKYPAKKVGNDVFELENIQSISPYAFFGVQYIDTVNTDESMEYAGVAERAFAGSYIRKVDMSHSLNLGKIDSYAFNDCPYIEEIIFPNQGSIREFGFNVFKNCPSLTEITLPYGIETFGTNGNGESYMFQSCGLTHLELPDSIMSTGYRLVSDCNRLRTIRLPKFMRINIYFRYVVNCNALEEVVLPIMSYYDSETYIVFDGEDNEVGRFGSESEANMVLPEGGYIVVEHGENVVINQSINMITNFDGCRGLKKYILNENDNRELYDIYNDSLYDAEFTRLISHPSGKYDVVFPSTITEIGQEAFRESVISAITIPNTVTSIGQDVFYRCNNLTNIIIPENISEIPVGMFRYCQNLEEVYFLCENITGLQYAAFDTCRKLNKIYICSKNAPLMRTNYGGTRHPFGYDSGSYAGKDYAALGTNKIYVPYGATGYDFDGDETNFSWVHPVTDSDKCGYSFETMMLSGYTISLTIMDGETSVNIPSLYAVSESGNYKFDGNIATAQYYQGAYEIMMNGTISDGEKITLYSDIECTQKIAEFTPKLYRYEYTVEKYDELLGARSMPSKFSSGLFDNDGKLYGSGDETVNITKSEYDALVSKINYLTELIHNIK